MFGLQRVRVLSRVPLSWLGCRRSFVRVERMQNKVLRFGRTSTRTRECLATALGTGPAVVCDPAVAVALAVGRIAMG